MSKAEKRKVKLEKKRAQVEEQRQAAIRRKKNKQVLNYAIVFLAVAGVFYLGFTLYQNTLAPGQYDDFAQCLTREGTAMFGTDWCPFCQEQKRMFGNSFVHVTYINCDANPAACAAESVTSYPTWINAQGERASGVQSLEQLAQMAGCPLEANAMPIIELEGETQA